MSRRNLPKVTGAGNGSSRNHRERCFLPLLVQEQAKMLMIGCLEGGLVRVCLPRERFDLLRDGSPMTLSRSEQQRVNMTNNKHMIRTTAVALNLLPHPWYTRTHPDMLEELTGSKQSVEVMLPVKHYVCRTHVFCHIYISHQALPWRPPACMYSKHRLMVLDQSTCMRHCSIARAD